MWGSREGPGEAEGTQPETLWNSWSWSAVSAKFQTVRWERKPAAHHTEVGASVAADIALEVKVVDVVGGVGRVGLRATARQYRIAQTSPTAYTFVHHRHARTHTQTYSSDN